MSRRRRTRRTRPTFPKTGKVGQPAARPGRAIPPSKSPPQPKKLKCGVAGPATGSLLKQWRALCVEFFILDLAPKLSLLVY